MICDAAIVTKDGIDSAMVVVLEEDRVFGDTQRLRSIMQDEGYFVRLWEGPLSTAGWRKRRMTEEFATDENGNIKWIKLVDVNDRLYQQVLSTTEFVFWLGEERLMPWDAILDGAFNRWVLMDMKDQVRFEIKL